MRQRSAVALAVLLVVGAVAAVPASVAAQTATETAAPTTTPAPTATPAENETADENASGDVDPGARLAGVVGVGAAEFDGDVESRAYGVQVAQAATANAKADVVAGRLSQIEQRLATLEERNESLAQARANGSMSESEYRAKVATLHARTENVKRLANQTDETASGLPADVLAEKGIDAAAIRTLQSRANELGGPQTAEIARSIAGDDVGQSARPAGVGDRGPSDGGNRTVAGNGTTAGNETDRGNGSDARGQNDRGNGSAGNGRPADSGNTTRSGDD